MTKLVSVTRQVDDPGPLLDRLPERDGVAWVLAGDGLIGAGAALRIDAGAGPGRFTRARDAYAAFLDEVQIDDEVEAPGTGPTAIGSFTFADRSVGSVLLVPSVVVGRLGGTRRSGRSRHRDGVRRRRLHPYPGGLLWPRRVQAVARSRAEQRRMAWALDAGVRRAARG